MRDGAVLRFLVGVVALTLPFGGRVPVAAHATATAVPTCTRRAMQVVAHADDDLLFMNPDVLSDVRHGVCVRTVYLTAGDGGHDLWGGREAGERAAYARMAGVANRWSATDAGVPGTRIRLQTLTADPNVSLVFLRLPDGDVPGGGFAGNGYASLKKLWEGTIPAITTVDARPVTYTKAGLIAALGRLVTDFAPGTIRVQDSYSSYDAAAVDHTDHRATARLVTAAQATYTAPHTLVHYLDYPTKHRPANVAGADLAAKKAAFYAYAAHDPKVCGSDADCAGTRRGRAYQRWLARQYVMEPAFGPLRAPDGRCAGLAGGSRLPGTGVVVGGCGAGPARGFHHTANGEIRALGSTCLDARGGAVTIQPCTGVRSQSWRLTPAGELRDALGDRCLTAPRAGTDLAVARCGTAGAQRGWSFTGVPLTSAKGRCVDAGLRLRACDGTPGQRWHVSASGEVRGPGDACLDGAADGPVTLSGCTGSPRQQWSRGPGGTVVGPGGGCLTAGGIALEARPCTGAPQQRWSLGDFAHRDATGLTGDPPATIAKRDAVVLTTTLRDTASRSVVGGAVVRLYSRSRGRGAFRAVRTATTDGGGVAAATVSPAASTEYRWRYDGGAAASASWSPVVTVTVDGTARALPGAACPRH